VWSPPAVAGGKVYVGSWDGNVYCLDADTGSKIWNYSTGSIVDSSPAVCDGKVYVGSYDCKVYCLDADTGLKIWNYTTGNEVRSSPAVVDGKVYVGSWDGNVYCLDADNGSKIWNYQTGNFVWSSPVWSSPAVSGGKVYVGSFDGNVYAFGVPFEVRYLVTFSEQGLLSGTQWAVTFGGQTQITNGGNIIFSTITPGSYAWNASSQISVRNGERYISSANSGTIEIASQNVSQTIEYTHQYSFTITAQPSGSISYSYPGSSGTVSGGSTEVIYVPAGTTVLLSAQPSSFLYQFNSWTGATTSSNSQISLNVDSPMSVESAFSYNFMNVGLITGIVIAAVLAGIFMALQRRKH
jgi:outer membrane protein assembly factor BamB